MAIESIWCRGYPYSRQSPHRCFRLRCLTSYSGKSLLLIVIEGLMLPNKPCASHQISCLGHVSRHRKHICVRYRPSGRLGPIFLPLLPPPAFVEQVALDEYMEDRFLLATAFALLIFHLRYPPAIQKGIEVYLICTYLCYQ